MKAELLESAEDLERTEHVRAGRRIEYLSLAWTTIEGALAIAAGWLAGSVALIGFGADSVIEIASSASVLWRLYAPDRGERRERIALRLVGVCFLALALYVAIESGRSLWSRRPPETSYFGIVVAIVSMGMMSLLAFAKRRAAEKLHSASLAADSRQSSICAYLSAILLVGLALNAAFGWWWADPLAALAMLPIILKEGVEALRGETCGCEHH